MTAARSALITGVAGQDGSYLAELLLERGYEVVGVRRAGKDTDERIAHLVDRLELVDVDLLDADAIGELLRRVRPREVYNLAGHSFVPSSWDEPNIVGDVTGQGPSRLLEAIRTVDPGIRFFQASSSEVFGNPDAAPQSEATPLRARNPYGEAKVRAQLATVRARERDGLFAVAGILFNHESPRRGLEFVSRKVSDGVARIAAGQADSLPMGDLEGRRDWGFAGDYVRAMWLALNRDEPADYVIATGTTQSVRDMCRIAFGRAGLDYQRYVTLDPSLVRSRDPVALVGDPSRARNELGWQPEVSFQELIEMMVDADLRRLGADRKRSDGSVYSGA